jgi:hypothetical protein
MQARTRNLCFRRPALGTGEDLADLEKMGILPGNVGDERRVFLVFAKTSPFSQLCSEARWDENTGIRSATFHRY